MKVESTESVKSVRNLSVGFSVFFAFAIVGLVALSGYFVADEMLRAEKENWRLNLERHLDYQEQQLGYLHDTAELFADNSYVINGIMDVAGRVSYLPRELENMKKARKIVHVGVFDFIGNSIALSPDFPEKKIDKDLLRYVIETGRMRLWCDPEGQQIFGAVPINYYNTPQGALLYVSKIGDLHFGADDDLPKSGRLTILCGDQVVTYEGPPIDNKKVITLEASPDRERHPLSYMLSMKLKGEVAWASVLRPSFYLVLRLAVLGLIFIIVGGYIARFIERELIVARDGALEASRARSQFLANMSHEIRTPLNGVIGNVNLLLEEQLTIEQRALAYDAKLSGQNLLELLNDVLDFSKIDAGFMRIDRSNIDLRKLVQTVERTFRGAMHEKGLTYIQSIDDNVPGEFVGDSLRIRQILNNFFSNSVKFTETGSITLQVKYESASKFLIFTVEDTGIGIPRDRLDTLFSPFTQAEESTTRRFGGTGLGLSICRQLAQLMGGEVSAASEGGIGSVFTLRIPCRPKSEVAVSWNTDNEGFDRSKIEPMAILLVEDNAVNASLMSKILAKYGHAITLATNGQEAVELALMQKFDLILMDCQMPVMDGYEATRKIIEALGKERPRIVALTANSFKEDRDRCLAAGMSDFLTKPVARDALEKIMRSTSGVDRINQLVKLEPH